MISRDVGHEYSRWNARKVVCTYYLYGYTELGDSATYRRDVRVTKSRRGRVSAGVMYRYCWAD